MIGARNDKNEVNVLLTFLTKLPSSSNFQKAGVKGLTKGLERSNGANDEFKERLQAIAKESDSDAAKAIADLRSIY